MINNSPRSAPPVSSATSNTPHGALHLAELHRFTNPAEAAASLALREGNPAALHFYLNNGRIQVGDLAKTTEDAFTAWVQDRSAGLDAIMLAPTRQLVAELNRRARDHRPDHTPTSAARAQRSSCPAFQAVQRYTDGLHVAAEQLVGPQTVAELDQADHYIPGLTTEPAWPTLRAHLLALAAETGQHPLRHLLTAAAGRDLQTAGDMAAVLYWRLPALTPTDPGPLPWLPGIPETLRSQPVWGPTWQSDPNWSPTSPTRFKITSAKVTARQPGLQPEVIPPPSFAKSQYGEPPAASIPKTRDQPEEANSIQPPPYGKQRLDWHIARSTNSSGNGTFDERQAAHTALSRSHHDGRRSYQTPGQRPNGPAAPGR
jgi:hypothetical protein